MQPPLISVILTVFKPRPYLRTAIESVLRQSFAGFELIVTDDGNCESNRRICESYTIDQRVSYRTNLKRLGPLLNVGAALNQARGKFVVILNDDDELEVDMLEVLVGPLIRFPECALAFGDRWLIDALGAPVASLGSANIPLARRQNLPEGNLSDPFSFALRGGVLIAMGVMFRRSALRQEWFNPQVGGAYDLWLGIQLSGKGGLYYVPRPLMRYRVHSDSESASRNPERLQPGIFIFESLLRQPLRRRDYNYAKKKLTECWFLLGREWLYCNNRQAARSAFVRSLRVKPQLKAAVGIGASYLPHQGLQLGVGFWRAIRGIHMPQPSTWPSFASFRPGGAAR